MSEILERMITMAQQDMEKQERDLCQHLTHLALALLKTPTAGTPRKATKKTKASRKQIRFADEDADAAEAREAATEAALQSGDDDDNDDQPTENQQTVDAVGAEQLSALDHTAESQPEKSDWLAEIKFEPSAVEIKFEPRKALPVGPRLGFAMAPTVARTGTKSMS
eukprot:COSAG06_NODE_26395_length_616_cov_0.551257_1_plen_165_part_01